MSALFLLGALACSAGPAEAGHYVHAVHAATVQYRQYVVSGFSRTEEVVAEIRVHGNHTTPDADILAIAGLVVGETADAARLDEAEQKLRASGRFDAVEVRRRSRSIANPAEILVILLVDERAAVRADDLTPGPWSRIRRAGMWLPILNHRDGYGLTYGARLTFVDPVGRGSRLSMPVTWGGERRIAAELERSFARGPLSTVRGSASVSRRVNPHFKRADTRQEVAAQAERALTAWLRAGAGARLAQVAFGTDNRRPASALASAGWHRVAGGHLTLDTRLDPSFPRNAVHATVGWERVTFPDGSAGRWTTDLRGYVGIGGSAVLALRGQASRGSAALPPSEQSLLGGSDSLRGYRAGHRAGDSVAAVSAEARLPLSSPLSVGRFGVKAFIDAGTTWSAGARLAEQRFDRGVGGGIYLGATALTASVDVAWPERGKPRLHVGLGVSF